MRRRYPHATEADDSDVERTRLPNINTIPMRVSSNSLAQSDELVARPFRPKLQFRAV